MKELAIKLIEESLSEAADKGKWASRWSKRSHRFVWNPEDIEIVKGDGSKKVEPERDRR